MYRQIIHPENKSELIVHLPEEFLGKDLVVNVNEVKKKKKIVKKKKTDSTHARKLAKAKRFFNSISVDMSNFKFNREEANAR